MALTIAQNHTYREYGHGSATVRFVVSNDYERLFDEVADWTTNVVLLDSVAQDLETDDLAFAVDELQFAIDGAACDTDEKQKTLFFMLGAADTTKSRFVAVFMNPTYTAGVADIETLLFIGKLDPTVAADDHVWHGGQYDSDVQAVSMWKFTAKSFDIKIFDEIKVSELFDGYFAPGNLTETPDVEGIEQATIDALFSNKPYYATSTEYGASVGGRYTTYLFELGNLYAILTLLMEKCEEIIAARYGFGSFIIDLQESSVGVGAIPYRFILSPNRYGSITDFQNLLLVDSAEPRIRDDAESSITELEISNDEFKGVFIEKHMLCPTTLSEKTYSMRGYDTVSELLFGVAAAFGMYLRFQFVGGNHIVGSFLSQRSFYDSDEVFLRGADKSAVQFSPVSISEQKKAAYGRSTLYSLDGLDRFDVQYNYFSGEPAVSEKLRLLKDKGTKTADDRVLFTTGVPLVNLKGKQPGPGSEIRPVNTVFKIIGGPAENSYRTLGVGHFLYSGLYIKISHTTSETADDYDGSETVSWRNIAVIVSNVDNAPIHFNSLTDFVNSISSRNGDFYKTELSLNVPFWNGFAEDSTGANASWKRCKLGAKYSRTEQIRTFDETTNEWDTAERTDVYSIIGIKWSLTQPVVELKLHRLSRFAYTEYDGDPEGIVLPSPEIPPSTSAGDDDTDVASAIVNEDLIAPTVVSVNDDASLIASLPIFSHYRKIVGVTLTDGDEGETVLLKTGGRISNPAWEFTPGAAVFLRSVGGEQVISQEPLTEPAAGETMFVKLGTADTITSFIWELEQYKFYGAEDP